MKEIDCEKYVDIEDCYEKFWEGTRKEIECNYCWNKIKIEKILNDEWIWDLYLDDFIIFYWAKLRLEWKDVTKMNYKDRLPYVLDLIWKLVEERKVKVEEFDIVKYSNEGKESWDYRKEWYLDPCKIDNEKELKKRIEEWKEKVKNKYEYLVEKYGERSAEILFDIIEVLRADCYDWEIRID